ncbi:hypothetical protein Pcinc_034849 [Petrolisthes cinctipes]|uniref:Uncharacterized protein n=1 Tax=Petrolisthes cinctipes TaxID=88211 RepID=A0AAE1C0V0_PETCI|nr:hypothetical protein Pcinc_034849 [Petrolisthes cinctipes]
MRPSPPAIPSSLSYPTRHTNPPELLHYSITPTLLSCPVLIILPYPTPHTNPPEILHYSITPTLLSCLS